MKHQPQLSGIATALAKQGRHGDDTLIHVSRKELAALERMGDGLGVHLTKNPQTGLPEAFNWMGTLGGIAGGIIGGVLTAGNPMGVAAGAALGSGAGTAAGGGSTKQALTAGVISGITGFATAGVGNALADVGTQATTEALANSGTQALGQTGGQTLGQTGGQTLAEGSSQGVGTVVGDTFVQNGTQALTQTPLQQFTQTGTQAIAEGSTPAAGTMVGDKFVQYPSSMSYGDKLSAGWDKITSSPKAFGDFASANMKGIATTGIGALGVGALNPTESTIDTGATTSDNGSRYKGEMYQDPATGQWRSRAVRTAAEGGPMFSDYDAADAEADGGYSPGGVASLNTGGDAKAAPASFDLQGDLPEYMVEGARLGPSRFRREDYAMGGGIGNLGSFSDGGRLLKGPGDGISDNIPATIENKRPARLADGEFVIPARAVSELGNGSTEAGSKQLYKMLDRIAAKRKNGKGLAYQANPQKLMPA